MFSTISMTGVGAIIAVIEGILRLFGVDFPEGSVSSAVNGIASAIGLILLVIGQLRRKDLRIGLVRR